MATPSTLNIEIRHIPPPEGVVGPLFSLTGTSRTLFPKELAARIAGLYETHMSGGLVIKAIPFNQAQTTDFSFVFKGNPEDSLITRVAELIERFGFQINYHELFSQKADGTIV